MITCGQKSMVSSDMEGAFKTILNIALRVDNWLPTYYSNEWMAHSGQAYTYLLKVRTVANLSVANCA